MGKRIGFAAASAALLFLALPVARKAAAQAGPPAGSEAPHTEMVQFPVALATPGKPPNAPPQMVSGFLATPAKSGVYPAIVVVHEWWGLTDWIKDMATRLAAAGYVALAPDLYGGKVAADPVEAGELSRGLTDDRAIQYLNAGVFYLAARKNVDRARIGVIGWSMGGGYAVQLAMRDTGLKACVVNYGPLPTDPTDLESLGAPVLGNFGGKDGGVTPADAQAFEKTMKSFTAPAPRVVDVKIYPDAGYAFMNPNGPTYRPEDAADAWTRTLNFLNKWLKQQ